jgi:hypothetical protein
MQWGTHVEAQDHKLGHNQPRHMRPTCRSGWAIRGSYSEDLNHQYLMAPQEMGKDSFWAAGTYCFFQFQTLKKKKVYSSFKDSLIRWSIITSDPRWWAHQLAGLQHHEYNFYICSEYVTEMQKVLKRIHTNYCILLHTQQCIPASQLEEHTETEAKTLLSVYVMIFAN